MADLVTVRWVGAMRNAGEVQVGVNANGTPKMRMHKEPLAFAPVDKDGERPPTRSFETSKANARWLAKNYSDLYAYDNDEDEPEPRVRPSQRTVQPAKVDVQLVQPAKVEVQPARREVHHGQQLTPPGQPTHSGPEVPPVKK